MGQTWRLQDEGGKLRVLVSLAEVGAGGKWVIRRGLRTLGDCGWKMAEPGDDLRGSNR